MATLEEVLGAQKRHGILQAPTSNGNIIVTTGTKPEKAATASTLNISLQNNTTSSNVWAYITGLDINKNNAVFLLQSDGKTGYYPQSPASTQSPLLQNCHIQLGAPGTSRAVTIPQIAGGRIWFCRDNQLRFLLNPGPALVEPSVTNPSDPNYSFYWSFAEFTFNTSQLFANISYVDFVSLPISLALKSATAGVANQVVTGMSPSGLDTVCANLVAQNARDGAGWDKLIVKSPSSPSSSNLRALSPNAGIVMDNALFAGYYQPYVDAVWAKYASSPLTVDTQAQWGVLQAQVSPATKLLTFPDAGAFPQPSSADIFSCSTGAFAWYPGPNGDVMGNITARLAAAFNRSTLLVNADQPAGETVASYYKDGAVATNHYARIVHAANADGKGYAFPYDDVAPEERLGVAGTVSDGNPGVFAVAVGGGVAVVDGGVPCCLLRVLG